ncbi:precorrin-3B synthase [Chenggangzhangella methanolivorans]|uniref:Precorrin-3B synthase n=1 Tax=Chenggangzhangella methanolivorans TaxID=1437009 RepID=A0A9E6R9G5_9HYPH|nr:precorrin-3B synthase [Chenggangzhangella methanolivorans]QZN99996.1 precorrin-3B synthase [Chenggangzhangella methanolivorans]
MADCPGIVHLALMADGGLARLRAPGGLLTAGELGAVADAAERLGSGVVDLTNRANLQIRGLAPDGGRALAAMLEVAGFRFHGEADRRRNILIDPFSGLDPAERRDMRPLSDALDRALVAAPWIAALSPKFSFALDGGGVSNVSAITSDVTAIACEEGIEILVGGRRAASFEEEASAVDAMIGLAETAARAGADMRGKDLWGDGSPEAVERGLSASLSLAERVTVGAARVGVEQRQPRRPILAHPRPLPAKGRVDELSPRFGTVLSADPARVAVSLAAPVGRLDPNMLRVLADAAEREGDGVVRLAPWSGVVLGGVAADRAGALIEAATSVGFVPPEVARRLRVVACAGAPACERATEPAKALGAAALALASAEPERLPKRPRTLHLSACAKGCAGSAPADLLLLGASEREGWTLHRDAAPRRPGPALERDFDAKPADLLARLAADD